jgi:hypothetical protein
VALGGSGSGSTQLAFSQTTNKQTKQPTRKRGSFGRRNQWLISSMNPPPSNEPHSRAPSSQPDNLLINVFSNNPSIYAEVCQMATFSFQQTFCKHGSSRRSDAPSRHVTWKWKTVHMKQPSHCVIPRDPREQNPVPSHDHMGNTNFRHNWRTEGFPAYSSRHLCTLRLLPVSDSAALASRDGGTNNRVARHRGSHIF